MEQLIGRPQHSDALVAQQLIVPIYGGTRRSELQQRQHKRAFHGWNEQRCRLVRSSAFPIAAHAPYGSVVEDARTRERLRRRIAGSVLEFLRSTHHPPSKDGVQ